MIDFLDYWMENISPIINSSIYVKLKTLVYQLNKARSSGDDYSGLRELVDGYDLEDKVTPLKLFSIESKVEEKVKDNDFSFINDMEVVLENFIRTRPYDQDNYLSPQRAEYYFLLGHIKKLKKLLDIN